MGASGAAVSLLANPFPFAGSKAFATATANAGGTYRIPTGVMTATTRYFARLTAAGISGRTPLLKISVRPSVRWTFQRLSGRRLRFTGTIRPGGQATVWLRRVGPVRTSTVKRMRAHQGDPGTRTFSFTITAPRKRTVYRIRVQTDTHSLVRFDTAPRAVAGHR